MDFQQELLQEAHKWYQLSQRVQEAYRAIPRHEFLHRFSPDYIRWLTAGPEHFDLIYADTTLLLYEKEGFVSTISQPSFVLRMLDLLDLHPGMKAFELGAGSGWNAAMMGFLVGKSGSIKSYEIIPDMTKAAQENVAKFDLPQVEIIQGDALSEIWEEEEFDRGIFTAGSWDLPGILFDVIKTGGKLLFVLKTSSGDILLAMEKFSDHFKVFETIYCRFVNVTGDTTRIYHNDLSQIYRAKEELSIWPQGTTGLNGNLVAGRDMIFKIGK